MKDVFILNAKRTPIGAFQGVFKDIPAPKLAAEVIKALFDGFPVPKEEVEQIYMGCVLQAGQGQAPARQAGIYGGLPLSCGAVTVHKVCGSGLKSVMLGANDIRVGEFSLVVAGGMESMSQVPYALLKARDGYRMGNGELIDLMIYDGLWDPYGQKHMGNCGELCSKELNISREEQDRFAIQSYKRAQEAYEKGYFKEEIVPIKVPAKGDPVIVDKDEEPYRIPVEKIPKMRPAFQEGGTITAGNASKINDGASALILGDEEVVKKYNLKPMARILGQATHSQEPEWFTTAPAKAIKKLLQKTGFTLDKIDLLEVNEAFAVVALATLKELEYPEEKTNIHGGAVALGHPIGASGARILTTLLYALKNNKKKYGIASICIGGGEACAVLVENLL
ncbi:MAG: thiolase family protein [Thermoanaerobaculia bacterium]